MNKSSQELIHPVLPIAIFLQRKGKYHETVTHMIILFSRLQEAFREFYLLFDMIILQANPRTEALSPSVNSMTRTPLGKLLYTVSPPV
mgnify:CR=1 FL=1